MPAILELSWVHVRRLLVVSFAPARGNPQARRHRIQLADAPGSFAARSALLLIRRINHASSEYLNLACAYYPRPCAGAARQSVGKLTRIRAKYLGQM